MQRRLKQIEGTVNKILILNRVMSGELTQVAAGEELQISARHVRRLLFSIKNNGMSSIYPKPRPINRKFSSGFKANVLSLIQAHYVDFGPTFAAEKLQENHGIILSRETLRLWMLESGLRTKKKGKKNKVHQSRLRRPRFGELVQIDGSHHDWFEGRGPKCCLIVMIDDATSRIVFMRFEPSETTFGYMQCIESHVKKHGTPIAYYSDRHSIFKTTREECVDGKLEDTSLHKALKKLKIELICAHSPQAKGRVERANATLQDRLIKEMRLAGINNIDDANAFLGNFTNKHNEKFSVPPHDPQDAHRPLTLSDDELELVFSSVQTRKLSKNLELSFERKIYQIQNVGKGYRLQNKRVEVLTTSHGKTIISYNGKVLEYKILERDCGPQLADAKDINQVMDKLLQTTPIARYPQGPQPPSSLGFVGPRWQGCGLVDNAA